MSQASCPGAPRFTGKALDTFVVQHVEITDVSAQEASQGVTSRPPRWARPPSTITDTSYAADHKRVFAINGDYYGFRDTGIVIRNGVV